MAASKTAPQPVAELEGHETTSRRKSTTPRLDTAAVKQLAAGRWAEVVAAVVGPEFTDGRRHHCPLPGHDDHNPSWRWDATKERWHCTCASGDALALIMAMEGCSFPDALRRVAGALGIGPTQATQPTGPRRRTHGEALRIGEQALDDWHNTGCSEIGRRRQANREPSPPGSPEWWDWRAVEVEIDRDDHLLDETYTAKRTELEGMRAEVKGVRDAA